MMTVHGRTRQQFYKGVANWSAVEAVVEATRLPVIVNGDIADMAAAQTALRRSGAKAVMVGRAALGRPWLVGCIARGLQGLDPVAQDNASRAQAALEHYEGLLSLYGREVGLRHARKHLAAYADHAAAEGGGLTEAERAELVTSDVPERVARVLESAFLDRGVHQAQQRLVA
jgi:tRNA-dihydrouridine synthase B